VASVIRHSGRVAVIYYSASGNVHALAQAVADGVAFGTPTRFGNVAAQLKQFIDQAGRLCGAALKSLR
jgi:multimeric flavodoxin WrbA